MDLNQIFLDVSSKNPSLMYVLYASLATAIAVVLGFVFIFLKQRRELNKKIEEAQLAANTPPRKEKEIDDAEDTDFPEKLEEDKVFASKWPTEGSSCKPENEPFQTTRTTTGDSRDPIEFCGHIQGEVKRTKQRLATKKIQEEMTEEQKEKERQAQRDQLAAIFKMISEQNAKFGINSMDDIQDQMNLYTM